MWVLEHRRDMVDRGEIAGAKALSREVRRAAKGLRSFRGDQGASGFTDGINGSKG
jgi:hypothetical protein